MFASVPGRERRRAIVVAREGAGLTGSFPARALSRALHRGESATERNTFHFHEQYRGKAGFEAHTQAPHFKVCCHRRTVGCMFERMGERWRRSAFFSSLFLLPRVGRYTFTKALSRGRGLATFSSRSCAAGVGDLRGLGPVHQAARGSVLRALRRVARGELGPPRRPARRARAAVRVDAAARANLAKISSCRIDPPTSLVYGGWHGKGRKKEMICTKPTRFRADQGPFFLLPPPRFLG